VAIFGTVATLEKQACPKKYGKVLEYLKTADLAAVFAKVTPGNNQKVEIDGEDVYAIFQTYTTKKHEDARLEGHRVYADVQYIFEGEEMIGYCDINDIIGEPSYNAEKDVFFTEAKGQSNVTLRAGDAAILEPSDMHAPCMMTGEQKAVKKIVFKVKY